MNYCLQILLLLLPFLSFTEEHIQTVYGNCTVTEPVLCELINSNAFNRLKGVHQYGIVHYIHQSKLPYTRYIHSLGVFFLLRQYGATIKEQIAGLLHDVSHTVFSHVGDHLMDEAHAVIDQSKDAYQDEKHLWILSQTDVADILAKYDRALESINHKNGNFNMLEQELPDICADRLEYNLYGGLAEGWLTQEDIDGILSALHYGDDRWFFDDQSQAKKLADISIRLCRELFAAPFNAGSYNATAQALMRAVEINLINYHDILFAQDDAMLALLNNSTDDIIKNCMYKALHAKELYVSCDNTVCDLSYIGKFRGINPWVKIGDALIRLTDCDDEFKVYYEKARCDICTRKYYRFKTHC